MNCVLFQPDLEKLQLRNLMVKTMIIKLKWFELGLALCIPIDKLEKLYDKYNDNPVKALVRVYRYWLADKNGLKPTWKKLITALQDIKEYNLAIGLEKSESVSSCCSNDNCYYVVSYVCGYVCGYVCM